MPCTDSRRNSRLNSRPTTLALAAAAALLAGCSHRQAPVPVVKAEPQLTRPATPTPPTPGPASRPDQPLPPPERAHDWAHFKHLAALRLVAANRGRTYDGPVPDPLLAIPVLEIELSADGQVRHVRVMRHPTQARDTTQLAIDAVHRAAPFGSVHHLPQPWKFAEVFLFNDDRLFKPRTLDLD